VFTDGPLLEALAGLADLGVRVGFSTSGAKQAEVVDRALALRVAGRPVFTAVQSTWNVLEPSVGPALRGAHEDGAHVLVKETLANGRLAVRPPGPVTQLAKRHGVGPDAVAIAAALAQPWADTVLCGPSSTGQLSSNLRALALRLSEEELDGLGTLAGPAEDYWSARATLAWR
jgi:aryl-alcohol dehydrogenase-like predicted oxidoreductase